MDWWVLNIMNATMLTVGSKAGENPLLEWSTLSGLEQEKEKPSNMDRWVLKRGPTMP